jgi:hypothetical protein
MAMNVMRTPGPTLKYGRYHSTCKSVTVKLIRHLLAILMVAVLVGAPAARAAFAPPCHAVVAGVSDHQLLPDQASAPAPTPCNGMPGNGMMPGCLDMLDCGLNAGLPVQAAGERQEFIWTSAIFRIGIDTHEGLTVKPDLGPPITV